MTLEFKSEDFMKLLRREKFASPSDLSEQLAKLVNRRLAEMLAAAPVVICRNDDGKWACDESLGFARATHSASLVQVEELPK